MRRSGDAGFALVAALGALLIFSVIAFTRLANDRGTLASVGGLVESARLAAAADAGLAMAVNGVSIEDRTRRWPLDGRTQTIAFDGMRLTIAVEDERGKIPLASIDQSQAQRMFELAGASADRASDLAAALLAQRDDADAPEASGMSLRTIEELRALPGMDDALYARLAGVVTLATGERGAFNEATAQPLALAVMSSAGDRSPTQIQRARELAGQRTAIDITADEPLIGRPLTIRVTVDDGSAGHMTRATVIEFVTASDWRIRYRA